MQQKTVMPVTGGPAEAARPEEDCDVGREFLEGTRNLTWEVKDEVLHCLLGPFWSDPSVLTSGQNSRMQVRTGETAKNRLFTYYFHQCACHSCLWG